MPSFAWSPSIGDPTIGGWITVFLYCFAAAIAWKVSRALKPNTAGAREIRVWEAICVIFVALGLNKQLDLQSAVTEAGRWVAVTQGWYDQRALVQVAFVACVVVIGITIVIALAALARRSSPATQFALLGTIAVLIFVTIRAASFHHIDRFIGTTIVGFRWNWILEMGGITVVPVGGWWRLYQIRCALSARDRVREARS